MKLGKQQNIFEPIFTFVTFGWLIVSIAMVLALRVQKAGRGEQFLKTQIKAMTRGTAQVTIDVAGILWERNGASIYSPWHHIRAMAVVQDTLCLCKQDFICLYIPLGSTTLLDTKAFIQDLEVWHAMGQNSKMNNRYDTAQSAADQSLTWSLRSKLSYAFLIAIGAGLCASPWWYLPFWNFLVSCF